MKVLVKPQLNLHRHDVDTVGTGFKNADPDMRAIFLAFVNDNNATVDHEMVETSDLSEPLIREHNDRLMASSKMQTHDESHPKIMSLHSTLLEAKQLNEKNCLHLNAVRRCITNGTYLRRLYMPPDSVMHLFPSIYSKMLVAAATYSQRAQRKMARQIQDITMTDTTGRRWSVTCDCKMSSSGTLYCRLTGGWSRFCRENHVTVDDDVVLMRDCGRFADVSVYVDRRGGS